MWSGGEWKESGGFDMLPWVSEQVDEIRKMLGKFFWRFGVEGNVEIPVTLVMLVIFLHGQGRFAKKVLLVSCFFH